MEMKMAVIFLVFVFVLSTHVSALKTCPKCGNIGVPYPLSTDDETCGDPRYRVYCNNDILQFLSADGFYYNILSINPSNYKLVIKPPKILENTCNTSDVTLGGFRLDDNLPFNISTHNTVILLNCRDNIIRSPLNCSSTSICREYEEKVEEARGCKGSLCCHYLKDSQMTSHRIRVRVDGCTAYTCLVDFKTGDPIGSWHYGIELQWLPPN